MSGLHYSLKEESAMQLQLKVRDLDNGILVVDCAGRLVFGEESAALREKVGSLLSQSNRILLSLADLTYMDSGGLGTLVSLYATARKTGGSIKLACLSKRVGDLLQVTKLLTVFEVYEGEQEAVQSFAKSAAA
jgi:anti-sigma B factor antagonist